MIFERNPWHFRLMSLAIEGLNIFHPAWEIGRYVFWLLLVAFAEMTFVCILDNVSSVTLRSILLVAISRVNDPGGIQSP